MNIPIYRYGTSYILLVCLWLDLYLCKMAYNSKNTTNRLIIIGTIAMLLYQQIQNLGMIIGLIPITGITLPLISYGGSSTLSYFILFGIILNLSPINTKGFRLHPRLLLQAIIDLFVFEETKPSVVLAFEKPKQALYHHLEQAKNEKDKRKIEKLATKSQNKNSTEKARDLFILSTKEKALFATLENTSLDTKKTLTSQKSLDLFKEVDKEPTLLKQESKNQQERVPLKNSDSFDFSKDEANQFYEVKNPYEIQSSTLTSLFPMDSLKTLKNSSQSEQKSESQKVESILDKQEEPLGFKEFDQLEKLLQLGFGGSDESKDEKEKSKTP